MENAEFGQDACLNCGWPGKPNCESDQVKFMDDGNAVCPECGEVCHYYDYRENVECAQCKKVVPLSQVVRAYGNHDDLFCDEGCAESWSDTSPD
jgi:acetyl-CoA carboxylase beta subunit